MIFGGFFTIRTRIINTDPAPGGQTVRIRIDIPALQNYKFTSIQISSTVVNIEKRKINVCCLVFTFSYINTNIPK